ncbi:DUF1801 domain-containing protein [Kiloniella sp. b19]|uniref:DUF1801 domain-containing protein n=1 Tax=Kiloniella sp. GXU_MW_B19 TaxID=3141326 RepID=UPI0031DF79E1
MTSEEARPAFSDPAMEELFSSYPGEERRGLLFLRRLIFELAAENPKIGPIRETVKWGQPAYLTEKSKSGTTIRLGLPKTGGFALYTHCQTTVMSEFQELFPEDFNFEGNRAVHFSVEERLPEDKIRLLIKRALSYHLK